MNDDLQDLLKENASTLKECSKYKKKNNEGKEVEYFLSFSDCPCYNFDGVKEKYCIKFCGKEYCFSSHDTLVELKNDKYVFIEFKGGYYDNRNIYKKNFGSLFAFNDIKKKTPDFARKNVQLVFVIAEPRLKERVRSATQAKKPDKLEILKENCQKYFKSVRIVFDENFAFEIAKPIKDGSYSF